MFSGRTLSLVNLAIFSFSFASLNASFTPSGSLSRSTLHNYRLAHSYGEEYTFSERDGWQSVSVTDLPYKYNTRSPLQSMPVNSTLPIKRALQKKSLSRSRSRRCKKPQQKQAAIEQVPQVAEPQTNQPVVQANPSTTSQPPPEPTPRPTVQAASVPAPAPSPAKQDHEEPNKLETLEQTVSNTVDDLKGVGSPQDVVITWYTGQDLQHPSCWANSNWAPSDESFACALTLEGWTTKPSCFKFLELCNGPDKCIFVRVVDTCAGCQKGSKHVDLTKAAFSQLASLDDGKLTVQMRIATDPTTWYEDLWGPLV
ncbi:hypothetical protein FRB99_003547 [Tulasnella sp. 403]|nr:hypothetical protein FRB99_003547 [Tulasnella sp. 403]